MTKLKTLLTKRSLFAALGIIVIALIVFAGLKIYPIVVELNERYQHLDTVADELNGMVAAKDLNLDHGLELLHEANIEILAIRDIASPYYGTLKAASGLPWVGKYAAQVQPVIEYAVNMLAGVDSLAGIVTSPDDGQSITADRDQLVQQVVQSSQQVEAANEYMVLADEYYEQIQLDLFPEKVQSKLGKLNEFRPLLSEAIKILRLVPVAAGDQKPVTYLITLQNSDELRPTGGFITSFGLLRVNKGKVTHIDFNDSTHSNYISHVVEAPAPLKQILLAYYWLPRDANWSPSFPESAAQVQELYFLSTGVKTDGVIALNQSSIQKLLVLTGPVDVEGETVSADTAIEYMIEKRMEAIHAGDAWNRKDFIALLAKALIAKLPEQTGTDHLLQFYKTAREMANRGELFVYSNEPAIQSLLNEYHLDGSLQPGTGDYLMLVDANLGYNKNDYVIKRGINYTVDLSDVNAPKSTVTISYNNPLKGEATCQQAGDITADPKSGYIYPSCYWSYFRVMGPSNMEVTSFQLPDFDDAAFKYSEPWGHDLDIATRLDTITEAGGLLVLPTDTTNAVIMERALPSSVVTNSGGVFTYTLVIQKQSGISELPITLTLSLPAGAVVQTGDTNIPFTNREGKWEWQGNLTDFVTNLIISYK